MFFAVFLSRDGKRLSFGMRPFLRGAVGFALFSVLAMIAFTLTPENLADTPLAGKVNLVVFPVLLALGFLYRYRLLFDAEKEEVCLDRGLVFLYRRKRYRFDEVTGVMARPYATRKLDPAGTRYVFGFYLSGRPVILERSCSPGAFRHFYYSFKSFFPLAVNEEGGPGPNDGASLKRERSR